MDEVFEVSYEGQTLLTTSKRYEKVYSVPDTRLKKRSVKQRISDQSFTIVYSQALLIRTVWFPRTYMQPGLMKRPDY